VPVLAALIWGAVAASSLIIGALLALVRRWPDTAIGSVLSFGAGALIASVAFSLFEEGVEASGGAAVAIGLTLGALTFFFANRAVERFGRRSGSTAGLPLALGAVLDGIPEQAVLGIGLAAGEGISAALVVAIFVSNLPESMGSANDMLDDNRPRKAILWLWGITSVACMLATVAGYGVAQVAGQQFDGIVEGFAAGALLVMMIDSMIPEAREKAGDKAGLIATLGFAVGAGLAAIS
jgi:ZIP family zinc transporter